MEFKSRMISVSLIANLTLYPLVIPNAFAGNYNATCDQVSCFVKLDTKGIDTAVGFMPYEGITSWYVATDEAKFIISSQMPNSSYYSFLINGYNKEGNKMSHSFDIDKRVITSKIMRKIIKNSGLSIGEYREVNVYEIMGD